MIATLRLVHLAVACGFALPATASAAAADPCPSRLIEKPDVDPLTGKETPAARQARRLLEMVANVHMGYQSCAASDPAFAAQFKPTYDEWRAKYRVAISSFERNAHAGRYVQCGLDQEKARAAKESAAGRTEKRNLCHQVIGPGIQRFIDDGPR